MYITIKVYLLGFLINFFWESLHSQLYEKCLSLPLRKYLKRIIEASFADSLTITGLIVFFTYICNVEEPGNSLTALISYAAISLFIAYFYELYALKKELWNYTDRMPTFLGAGITPLLQLAVTGIITFLLL